MQPEAGAEDILEVAARVGRAFEQVGARYMLVGSVASSLQGDPRTTNDIDFVTALPASRVEAFCAALGEDFDVDQLALAEAMAAGGSWNIFFVPWMSKIDLFAIGRTEFQSLQLARAARLTVGGHELVVLRPEDTVLSKLLWFRDGGGVSDQQWRDVLGVLRVSGKELDRAYLDEWSERLGIKELLERVMSQSLGSLR